MTEKDIVERIDAFRIKSGTTKAKMSRDLGIDAGTFGNILNGKRGMPIGMLIRFLEVYNHISAEWLLRGEAVSEGDTTNRLIAMLEEKDKQIDRLLQIIENR